MLRLLADENLNDRVARGLLLRQPDLDLVAVRDVGLAGLNDEEVLAWAAANGRIVLTNDRATMPDHARDRLSAAEGMPGLFVLKRRLSIGQAIDEILFIVECSEPAEWNGRIVYLPL